MIAVKLWSTQKFSCRQSGHILKGEGSWLLVRTLISKLSEEQLCCARKSCMQIHVLWRQPPSLGVSQLPDRNMLRKHVSATGAARLLVQHPWHTETQEGSYVYSCLGWEGTTVGHRAGGWCVFCFPTTAGETLTKLESKSEESSRRWAKMCTGAWAHRHADGHLAGIYKVILLVNVIGSFTGSLMECLSDSRHLNTSGVLRASFTRSQVHRFGDHSTRGSDACKQLPCKVPELCYVVLLLW